MLGRMFRRAPPASSTPTPASAPTQIFLGEHRALRSILPADPAGYSVLVNGAEGLFICNQHDVGVGGYLRHTGNYEEQEGINLLVMASVLPPAPVILDVGANIGIHTLRLSRAAGPAGVVHAFEAQRHLFHMLAGSMALNSVDNVFCHWQAVGATKGVARIPKLDYRREASFGSVELNHARQSDAGQNAIDDQFEEVAMISIDALGLARADLIKIDVEGMEAEVLAGAMQTLSTHHPLLHIEYIKSDKVQLWSTLRDLGYQVYDLDKDFGCFPAGHPGIAKLPAGMRPWQPGGA